MPLRQPSLIRSESLSVLRRSRMMGCDAVWIRPEWQAYSDTSAHRKAKMNKTVVSMFLMVVLAPLVVPKALATPSECREAVDQYNSALSDVSDALKRYRSCVADSQGHDDCSSEFSTLRSAQDDFESAVSEYESECN